jgi:NTP pyrophosphatase (non-canonical NTP hydrolase)
MTEIFYDDDMLRVAGKLHASSIEWFPKVYTRSQIDRMVHVVLGISGESGELANVMKKINRERATFDEDAYHDLVLEAADILIYVLLFFSLIGADPMEAIIEKHNHNIGRFGGTGV